MTRTETLRRTLAALLIGAALPAATHAATNATTPAELESTYTAQAGRPASAQRGELLFTTPHGREWRCASCHGAVPTRSGTHASTGKPIAPLAPAANPERFADAAKTEKWFRRNCNDVIGRECTPAEKADVLSWLRTLQP